VHHSLTQEQEEQRYHEIGIPVEFANFLAVLETGIKNGAESRVNNVVEAVTGHQPRKFRDFVEANKATW
jgi:festuclavine dehydrogenase